MLFQSAAGACYMLAVCSWDGTLLPGMELVLHDLRVSTLLAIWAFSITVGTAFVLRLVDEFDAVTAIVVTTSRKALTLFASFVLFPKQFGIGHPLGAMLVFGRYDLSQLVPPSRAISRHLHMSMHLTPPDRCHARLWQRVRHTPAGAAIIAEQRTSHHQLWDCRRQRQRRRAQAYAPSVDVGVPRRLQQRARESERE